MSTKKTNVMRYNKRGILKTQNRKNKSQQKLVQENLIKAIHHNSLCKNLQKEIYKNWVCFFRENKNKFDRGVIRKLAALSNSNMKSRRKNFIKRIARLFCVNYTMLTDTKNTCKLNYNTKNDTLSFR